MDRAQFMRELENLLADIPETERREALEFYENYFDDAGPENEASVLRELGSPEKVAAIIKADLKGSAEQSEYGEYTEHGYEDPWTKEPGQMPEKYGFEKKGSFFRKGNQAVLILAVILLVFISPFIKGMLGVAVQIVLTIVLLPFVLVAALGIGSAGLLIGGIGAVAVGICVFSSSVIGAGVFAVGIGFLMIALGILMVLATVKTAKVLVPKWFRKITDFGNKLLYRKKGEV